MNNSCSLQFSSFHFFPQSTSYGVILKYNISILTPFIPFISLRIIIGFVIIKIICVCVYIFLFIAAFFSLHSIIIMIWNGSTSNILYLYKIVYFSPFPNSTLSLYHSFDGWKNKCFLRGSEKNLYRSQKSHTSDCLSTPKKIWIGWKIRKKITNRHFTIQSWGNKGGDV